MRLRLTVTNSCSMNVTGVVQVFEAWLTSVEMNKPTTPSPTRQLRKPALNTMPPATGTFAVATRL